MKALTTKQILITSGSSVVIGVGLIAAGFNAMAGLAPLTQEDEPKAFVTVTDMTPTVQPTIQAPVTAPEPIQESTPSQTAPSSPAPVPAPAQAPAPSITASSDEATRREWVQRSGITEVFESVDAVVSYTNWDVNYIGANGRRGLCAHMVSNARIINADPVAQLRECNRFITGQYGSWQGAAAVLAARGQ